MVSDSYFDVRNLADPVSCLDGCPVADCAATLGKAEYGRHTMPYCPLHRIRIHPTSRTFVYYNGQDASSRSEAALRNIVFERDYFEKHVLGNAAKAESHRICHETSEDAVTWNVFSRLTNARMLQPLLSSLTNVSVNCEPELYLWGLNIRLNDPATPPLFPALKSARDTFEAGISKFLTEPDIMLYVPGHVLVLVEAKFTSGNTIALDNGAHDTIDAKPKSRAGLLERYELPERLRDKLVYPSSSLPFYSQLYRNLVFAIFMADRLGVKWHLVNLVGKKQFVQRQKLPNFQDPTPVIHDVLPAGARGQFQFSNWEHLYAGVIAGDTGLKDLAEYMRHKSANGVKAFDVL